MKETKIIGSLIAVLLLGFGLYGGIGTAEAQDIAQTQQVIGIGETAGKLCGIPLTIIYSITLMPLYDFIFGLVELLMGVQAINCAQMAMPFKTILKPIVSIGEKVIPESIGSMWNLLIVFIYKTLEGSQWLFEMIPLPFLGDIYKGIVGDCALPICLDLIL